MKKSFLFLFIGLMMFTNIGCDKDFEEINANPNEPSAVPSGLLIADIVRVSTNNLYNTFVGGDMGGCWAQHIAKVQYNDEARYIPRESIIESLVWKGFYEDVIADSKSIELLAIEEENPAMEAVGLILQAYGYSILTDAFGNIPFSEAIQATSEIFSPAYDSQENVYTGILGLLDNANSKLELAEGSINATSDILYGGDAAKWQKFANSLKFRSLMRISGVKDVGAQLTDLLGKPMFGSNDDEAKLQYLANDPNANPWYERIVFGVRGEWKVNSVLVDKLQELSDPRLGVFVAPIETGEYRGKPSGIFDVPNDEYKYNNVSPLGDFYLNPELPGYMMSYSELQFLMAEAAERGLISGDAATHYNEGIRANFETNGVTDGLAAYMEQGFVAYNSSIALQQIAEQNWLALFGQGFEAWTEWRRTGFPELEPAIEGAINEIPSRYTYPAIEQSVNVDGYSGAVSAQGPNLLTTKVWWMGN